MAMDKDKIIKISVGVAILAAIGGAAWYFLKDSKDSKTLDNKKITGGKIRTDLTTSTGSGSGSTSSTGSGSGSTSSTDSGAGSTSSTDSGAGSTPQNSEPQDADLVDLSLFDKSQKPTKTVRVSPDVYDTLMKFLPSGQGDAWRSLPNEMAVAFAMAFWWEYYWREKRTDIDHSPGASNFIRSKGIKNWGQSAGMNANITGMFFDKYGRPDNNHTPIPFTFAVPLPNLSGYVYRTMIVPSSSIPGYDS